MRTNTSIRGSGAAARDLRAESQMLTGDENIVDIEFVIYWRIRPGKDPKSGESGVAQYLFNIQNPEGTVKDIAESAMRDIVGRSEIQPILTGARQKIEQDVQQLMQQKLDSYRAGIQIDQVQLQKVDPPAEVIEAFRDVQAARADMETKKNEAFGYANKIVPEARGEAERILQGAEGYRQQTVAEAQGQTARFNQVLEQYLKAPDVTRRRIFLETMERVLGSSDKIILDRSGGAGGVVPYLPLDQLSPKKPQGAN
jgi:membrane protease subunit HflK